MKFAYLAVMIVLILIVCVALRHEARTHGRGADAYTVKGADAYSFKAMWNDSVGAYVAAIEMGGPHTGIVDTASPYLQVFDTYPCPASIECSPPLGQTKTTFADGTTAEQTFVRVSGGRVAIGGVDLPRNSVIGATTGGGSPQWREATSVSGRRPRVLNLRASALSTGEKEGWLPWTTSPPSFMTIAESCEMKARAS